MTLGAYRENQLTILPVKPQLGDVRIVYCQGFYRVQIWRWRFLWLGQYWMKIAGYDNYNDAVKEAKRQREFHNKKEEILWFNGSGKEAEPHD